MDKKISKSVLKRLPSYLSYLKSLQETDSPYISATALANALGMGEVQVRKDLAMVSDGGRPKIGYLRESLIDDIEQFLGYDNTTDAVLIGAGKLGQALLGYRGFDDYGLNILAAFDGVVTMAQKYAAYGNCIRIKHPCGIETLYSHNSQNLVKVGDRVKAGQVIALTGRTGRASTEHLHFECRINGRIFDPAKLFNHQSHSLKSHTLTFYRNSAKVTAK